MKSIEVRVSGISHNYGETTVLSDVSAEVDAGAFVSLLGPSGSGKTTLLRIIAGLVSPRSGQVWIGEREVTNVPPNRRDIGMVFQHYALFPHYSVFDNIAFPLRVRGADGRTVQRQVGEVLEMVGLTSAAGAMPGELSGGQQQRVAVARAIVFRPTVLLLDEPLGALDRRLRETLGLELRRLQRDIGITTIYVTHDQEEAFTLSTSIAVMEGGCIRQYARPIEVYRWPVDRFVAEFVGDMTVFQGVLESNDGRTAVALVDGGARLVAKAGRSVVNVGQRCSFGFRPESLRIERGSDRTSLTEFEATVESIVFLGSISRVYATTSWGVHVISECVRVPEWVEQGETVIFRYDLNEVTVFGGGADPDIVHHSDEHAALEQGAFGGGTSAGDTDRGPEQVRSDVRGESSVDRA
jgi:ABC-type Fe3+/spermidine/putrescine transport system ATPase subunit